MDEEELEGILHLLTTSLDTVNEMDKQIEQLIKSDFVKWRQEIVTSRDFNFRISSMKSRVSSMIPGIQPDNMKDRKGSLASIGKKLSSIFMGISM